MSVLLAGVAGLGGVFEVGLGIGEAGAGMKIGSAGESSLGAAWTVSGGDRGPSGKGSARLSILGVPGLGGVAGGLAGSMELSMSCMVCSNCWMLGGHGGNAT